MTPEEIIEAIQKLDGAAIYNKEPQAVSELTSLFAAVFPGQSVSDTCDGCVRKAYGKLQLLTINKIEIMNNSKFKLKHGSLLPIGEFGSGEFLSKDNLTDELAYQVLEQFPMLIEEFSEYPGHPGELLPKGQQEEKNSVTQQDIDNDPTLTEAGITVGMSLNEMDLLLDAYEEKQKQLKASQKTEVIPTSELPEVITAGDLAAQPDLVSAGVQEGELVEIAYEKLAAWEGLQKSEPKENTGIKQEELDAYPKMVAAGIVVGDSNEVAAEKYQAYELEQERLKTETQNTQEGATEDVKPTVKDLSNITKITLQKQYFDKFGVEADSTLTKPQLYTAINA